MSKHKPIILGRDLEVEAVRDKDNYITAFRVVARDPDIDPKSIKPVAFKPDRTAKPEDIYIDEGMVELAKKAARFDLLEAIPWLKPHQINGLALLVDYCKAEEIRELNREGEREKVELELRTLTVVGVFDDKEKDWRKVIKDE